VLHKLLELRLWPGSLWAALSTAPSKYATEQPRAHHFPFHFCLLRAAATDDTPVSPFPAVDTSLPASELIADSVKRSSRAHIFHFYALLCEIVSIPRKAASAWVTADHLVTPAPVGPEGKDKGSTAVHAHHPLGRFATGAGGPGHLVSLDARALARECLREVGRELGVPR